MNTNSAAHSKDKASSLGISAEQLRSTLYSGFGSRQISTIYGTGDSFYVVMEFTDKVNWPVDDQRRFRSIDLEITVDVCKARIGAQGVRHLPETTRTASVDPGSA